MRRALALLALLLPALLAAAKDAEPEAKAPDTWYAQALAHSGAGINVTHFWSKGPRLRAETIVRGHKIVTIVNGAYYTAYDAVSREGVAIERAPEAVAKDSSARRPFGRQLESLLAQGAERVRGENCGGRPCEIYRVTDGLGMRELWVTADDSRLPLRIEIFHRRSGDRQYTDFLNWLRGLPLPDAFFQPESGIEIERLSLEEYVRRSLSGGAVGPVPVLYADLLHGRSRKK